jgi:hypothetical protein
LACLSLALELLRLADPERTLYLATHTDVGFTLGCLTPHSGASPDD